MATTIAIVTAFAAIGALIDFWLGKNGQKHVRVRLEHYWLLLSDMNFGTFGKTESYVLNKTLIAIFGSFWSVKRLIFVTITFIIGTLIWLFLFFKLESNNVNEYYVIIDAALQIFIISLYLSLSISSTIIIARISAAYFPDGRYLSAIYIFVAFLISYIVAIFGSMFGRISISIVPAITTWQTSSSFFSFEIPNNWFSQFYEKFELEIKILIERFDLFSFGYDSRFWYFIYSNWDLESVFFPQSYSDKLSLFLAIFRVSLLLIFCVSFIIRSSSAVIMQLFARIVESDKPIFTLCFGGLAAMVQSFQGFIAIFY